ncbi:MAG: 5-(carboxyamino)imidazole ribonucleotide mutase [Nitrospina sp.]|nr:5-(carboxyamino)imidazole ribonucleotide mutase [Nitrospina sp.]MBT3414732.1 5-(carboxyamino)imidazole ribonucleotide mutase [Nitrospina sp.]MBT3855288.1 5-(carboxyamino)imidazole ribonucleotide mutase [Nitrospina sp.]MBT4105749.1 5-(carboxyamino)imidazole ribonucleotide mutase [Nitrospina sp.]MBT4620797.1 5-(carboxyamino)imidazole ribonucleotide mutase [Nitrospina sp.]
MSKPLVGIVMGSDSDFIIMEETSKVLEQFNVPHEVLVTSAHRSPERTRKYVQGAKRRGIQVLIAGAGGAAHLAGVVAAETHLPVIGVPIDATSLNGLDSLLSTAQMPGGVPVAAVSIGKPGAKNAGLLATQILALSDEKLAGQLIKYKKDQAKAVAQKSKKLKTSHAANFKG